MTNRYYLLMESSGKLLPNGDWPDAHDDESHTGHSDLRRAMMDLARTVAWKGGLDSWHFEDDALWYQNRKDYVLHHIMVRRETYQANKEGRFCGRDIQDRTLRVTPRRMAVYMNRLGAIDSPTQGMGIIPTPLQAG